MNAKRSRDLLNETARGYRGCWIWPKNYAGMYSARVEGYGQVAADTLAGIKDMIRYALRKGGNWPRIKT